MMLFLKVAGVVLGLWVLHRIAQAMEARGWIYYQKKPPVGGGVGNALQELNRHFRPSVEHVQTEKKRARKEDEGRGDDPDPA